MNKVELSWVESHIDILWYIHSATQPVTQFSIWYPYVRVACNANKTDIVSGVRISTYYSENRLTWPRVVKSVSKLSFIVLLLFCMYDLSHLPSTINWKRFFTLITLLRRAPHGLTALVRAAWRHSESDWETASLYSLSRLLVTHSLARRRQHALAPCDVIHQSSLAAWCW